MQTLLVTIIGPGRAIDLELPGDIPIRELLPTIITLCGPSYPSPIQQDASTWGLGIVDAHAPLPVTGSLADAKIVNGTTLRLQALSVWISQRGQKEKFVPKTIPPGPASGGIGIRWSKDGLLNG